MSMKYQNLIRIAWRFYFTGVCPGASPR